MKTFQFKKLEIQHEESWIRRTISSAHFKKTIAYSAIGALLGYALFYFGQGANSQSFWNEDALNNMLLGFGFGIFLTNSPCARGRC